MKNLLEKIYDYSLEEIMGERFGRYSKYIIQDRAIPDVRDGLKPSQRRILYAMYKDKNTYEKPYRKSVKTVGNVIGNYHPHGDSSVYEAMVRMSQSWKLKNPLIDMHGNNGSIDGDSAAAMRYTEARLAKISNELLRDIDCNTVMWAPNFDDTILEPTVLPARFPNLLVNGTNGISAGYATNIPPHNLGEIIDATIYMIDNEEASVEDLMQFVKGPDFPTGATILGTDGIREAYLTGKGKITIKSKYEIEKGKSRDQIIISEIPFEVNKAALVRKIDEIRIEKKIDGMADVRDESDREGLRIVIDVKKEFDTNLILNYLFKNTDLQISYSSNMVAIVNRRPKTLGLVEILKAYIDHQVEVVTKRSEFYLEHAKARMHIVEGLIKAISILDQVIATIRASKNKQDAINNLMVEYGFSEKQADAIVTLQLYRLTNTDVVALEEEIKKLMEQIDFLSSILDSKVKLMKVIKRELELIRNEYQTPRMSVISDETAEIKIESSDLIVKEDVVVVVTNDGYLKRVSKRSYNQSIGTEPLLKENDFIVGIYELNTINTILLFTDLGNYLYLPVHEIPDLKWRELGKHVSNIIPIKAEENIVGVIPVVDFNNDINITTFTKLGMIKITKLSEYKALRYSKPMVSTKLKDDDLVTNISDITSDKILITTSNGYSLMFKMDEVPFTGLRTSGVKAIKLKDDYVVKGIMIDNSNDYLSVITNKGTGKRIKLSDLEIQSRALKGNLLIRNVKTNPHNLIDVLYNNAKDLIGIKTKSGITMIKASELPIMDLSSIGSKLVKEDIVKVFKETELTTKKETEEPTKRMSLEEIDKKILTIDDFLDIE